MKKFNEALSGNPLRKHVYKEIEKAILDGVFEPGYSLTEGKLSAELGVSRTPVREALMQLELEGLVKTIPNKGAVVVGVTGQDIDDIYTIRTRIEGLAARRCAVNIGQEELEELRQVVELQEYFVTKQDFLQVWHLDNRFHENPGELRPPPRSIGLCSTPSRPTTQTPQTPPWLSTSKTPGTLFLNICKSEKTDGYASLARRGFPPRIDGDLFLF